MRKKAEGVGGGEGGEEGWRDGERERKVGVGHIRGEAAKFAPQYRLGLLIIVFRVQQLGY